MTNSPSSRLSPPKSTAASAPSPRAGTLARLKQIQPGHFLLRQLPHNFGADFTNTNETEAASPRPVSWRTRRQNRRSPCAESRPSLPFVKVNYVAHSSVSVACTSGDNPE